MTWPGATPRSRSSASSAWHISSDPGGSPPDAGSADCTEDRALQDVGDDVIGQAEAELAQGAVNAADRAQRLITDQRIVEAVLEEGLGGPRHRGLQDKLTRYSMPVLRHLLANGRLISKATQLGRPPSPPGLWVNFTADDREDFSQDMIARGLPQFDKVVFEEKRWTPAGGACLTTYFVNTCILCFARLQARWLNDRKNVKPAGLQLDLAPPAPDPADTVAVQDQASRVLRKITDPKVRRIAALRAVGWKPGEAAQEEGLTVKAAGNRIARLRQNIEDEQADTDSPAGQRSDTAQGRR